MTRLLSRLLRDETAVAFVEFAYVAPVFIALVLAGLELTNLALAHLRVSQIAMSVADNAGRTPTGIDEAHIHEVFAGASVMGGDLDFKKHGRIVLSSVEENGRTGAEQGQWIRWQRCWGEATVEPAYGKQGAGQTNAQLREGLGETGNRISAVPGTALMFVEATYQYQPLVGSAFLFNPVIRYESAFNVRGRQNNAITNTQSLQQLSC